MSRQRPLATASVITTVVAVLAIILSGGHSPFRPPASAVSEPVAAAVDATASAAPTDEATPVVDPTVGASPAATTAPATSKPTTSHPTGTVNHGSGRGSGNGTGGAPRPPSPPHPGATPTPTPEPTSDPTHDPTPAPTPRPTRFPASLSIALSDGQPRLSWSACTSSRFSAYAIVRSTDSEIHFPAESGDTLVALVRDAGVTSLVDHSARAGVRSYYRVWCTYNEGGEYQTIWTTPTVSIIP